MNVIVSSLLPWKLRFHLLTPATSSFLSLSCHRPLPLMTKDISFFFSATLMHSLNSSCIITTTFYFMTLQMNFVNISSYMGYLIFFYSCIFLFLYVFLVQNIFCSRRFHCSVLGWHPVAVTVTFKLKPQSAEASSWLIVKTNFRIKTFCLHLYIFLLLENTNDLISFHHYQILKILIHF